MQIFQFVGIAFITAVAALILKGTKPELAFAVTIAGSIILLLFVFELFQNSIGIFEKIANATGDRKSVV